MLHSVMTIAEWTTYVLTVHQIRIELENIGKTFRHN